MTVFVYSTSLQDDPCFKLWYSETAIAAQSYSRHGAEGVPVCRALAMCVVVNVLTNSVPGTLPIAPHTHHKYLADSHFHQHLGQGHAHTPAHKHTHTHMHTTHTPHTHAHTPHTHTIRTHTNTHAQRHHQQLHLVTTNPVCPLPRSPCTLASRQ